MEISIDWLEERAKSELRKIRLKKVSRWMFMFMSKKNINDNIHDAAKSLGRIEMIREIVKEFNK